MRKAVRRLLLFSIRIGTCKFPTEYSYTEVFAGTYVPLAFKCKFLYSLGGIYDATLLVVLAWLHG